MFKVYKKIFNNKYVAICTLVFIVTSFFNIISLLFSGFSDLYRDTIFRFLSPLSSRFFNLFSISIGEILIILFCAFLLIFFTILLLRIFQFIILKYKPSNKENKLRNITNIFFKTFILLILLIYVLETFNCFILYRCTTIKEKRYGYTIEKNITDKNNQLINVYTSMINDINNLSEQFSRDSLNNIVEYSVDEDMYSECIDLLKELSDDFSLLEGFYPEPKKIRFSGIMSQMYLAGIYFPFTMEANVNSLMYITNYPFVICHELAHLKGYIREDEANFIAYMACMKSKNDFIRYSGYLGVLPYLYEDITKSNIDEETLSKLPKIKYNVKKDLEFVDEDIMKAIEKASIFKTGYLSNAADNFIETNLQANGIKEGSANYNMVVQLILLEENFSK